MVVVCWVGHRRLANVFVEACGWCAVGGVGRSALADAEPAGFAGPSFGFPAYSSQLQSPAAALPFRTLPEFAVFVETSMDMTHDSDRLRDARRFQSQGSAKDPRSKSFVAPEKQAHAAAAASENL